MVLIQVRTHVLSVLVLVQLSAEDTCSHYLAGKEFTNSFSSAIKTRFYHRSKHNPDQPKTGSMVALKTTSHYNKEADQRPDNKRHEGGGLYLIIW